MLKKILATIRYMVDDQHPDIQYIENPSEIQSFTDCYRIDTEKFWGRDDYMSYIKNDLKLIAGGGYNCKHIHKVKFEFSTKQSDIDKFMENFSEEIRQKLA